MSFRFTVALKTLCGFALLAIAIIVVGFGGLRSINELNDQVQNVTDTNIPELVSSYDQSLRISLANEALLIYLQSSDENLMATQLKAFESNYKLFRQNLEASSNTERSEEVTAVFKQADTSSVSYYKYAKNIVKDHEEALELDYIITEQSQKLQTKLETINTLGQKISTIVSKNKPALKALRKLTTSVNQVRIAVRQYQLGGDIDRLFKDAARLRKQLQTEFDQLLTLEKKARFIKQHLQQLLGLIKEDEGLLVSLKAQNTLQKVLSSDLVAAKKQLTSTQQSSEALINIALEGTQAARETSNSTFTTTRALIISLIIVALIVASVTGYLVMITIQKPLRQVSKKLKLVGQGDMTTTFDGKRADEFGVLGADLNLLVSDLRSLLQQIINKSNELERTANKNSKISHDTTHAMGQQSSQLDATSRSAQALESSVAIVADQVKLTLEAVENCNTLTRQANTQVNETGTSVTTQAHEIEAAVEQSKQLEVNSQQIDNILGTINSIAEQTNLLALNAAIEAARAGEHGRGFAVVADEVRALASRTQNSTAEIQVTVENMKNQIQKVANLLENTHKQAINCVDLAQSSGVSLQELQDAISGIHEMSNHIANATEEQNNAVLDVSHHLEDINSAAQRTAQGAQEAEQSSDELLEIAQAQRKLTQRFSL